ncbi:MAG: NAD(P)H-dependent oxidoreductase [Solirubrobacterales bacterium]|nr:NAD(P)H-dependent oxidoreductase [Solirubrobacterales bacterium]MBV9423115.1 NAD(P)H-dependent oxidoreductase [Solirubrobacterales bacterium]
MRVLGFDGSPTGGGKTEAAIRAVLSGLPDGSSTEVIPLASGPEEALEAAEGADAFIFGSPIYRASYAAPMKTLLDRLPRGMWGEQSAPIGGRAVVLVGTGASWHHFLGLDPLRSILAGFFAAHVLPPGLYVPAEGFDDEGRLREPFAELAARQGAALGELTEALAGSPALRLLKPQA